MGLQSPVAHGLGHDAVNGVVHVHVAVAVYDHVNVNAHVAAVAHRCCRPARRANS